MSHSTVCPKFLPHTKQGVRAKVWRQLALTSGLVTLVGCSHPPEIGPIATKRAIDPCSEIVVENVYISPDVPPRPKHMVPAMYPEPARVQHAEGALEVRAIVGLDGSVCGVEILWSDTIPELEVAALAAARKWRFTPALVAGQPVAAEMIIPFRFSLGE